MSGSTRASSCRRGQRLRERPGEPALAAAGIATPHRRPGGTDGWRVGGLRAVRELAGAVRSAEKPGAARVSAGNRAAGTSILAGHGSPRAGYPVAVDLGRADGGDMG